MPGYGIVAAEEGDGLLPWTWARERLAAARNYFLATTRPDGGPHVMVVWGLWIDDTFQFSTGKASRKAKNLAAEPRCVVCPEGAEEAVVVEGVAADLTEERARARFFAAYEAKYGMDVSSMGEPLYVVMPRIVFGQIEKTFTKSATRWIFGAGH
jgi:pyridoxine/pyridoxamine 5'-phosphate oxidase